MAKYVCSYCQGDISGVRVQCAECSDFDLCLQCFSCSVEIGPHKKDHSYKILSDEELHIFAVEEPWSVQEENMLLDAVEQFGFGNWDDVSSHVESKTSAECENHYLTFYVHGNIGKATFPTDYKFKVTDHTCPDGGPLSPSITVPIAPVEMTIQEQQELGYMPFRDDFEREHDNEAETLISGMSITNDDEDIDIAIKLSQVDKYRLRLHERDRRKQIAREYDLISAASSGGRTPKSDKSKKKSKDEREFQEKMKVFCQFHPVSEHEQCFEDMQKEKELKSRIKELIRYRRHGLKKLDEIDDLEEKIYKRDKKKENKKKMGSFIPAKRNSMVSKKAEGKVEKLDILIDDDEVKDDEEEAEAKEMTMLPGFDMLSERERKLCSNIGMTPANYSTIKTCIIKDYLQRRQGLPVKIRYPSGMDKTHRRKIMSFLTDNGWIGVT
ncbi:transcriptional adapter 2-beta-like [Gigantopelta aegis]|uniref:transcriptional adapter 2-beta-like n=1 Tax=Gigantopelta aegis TaxID=1735272 RepID=UPI001B889AE1|nr:transcriptional adapter 2-beta-like [Gigantopelta aegis]